MNDISGVIVAEIKKDGQSRFQVEQDGFFVKGFGTDRNAALSLAGRLVIQHQERNTG